MNLEDLGWGPFFEAHTETMEKQGWRPARVVRTSSNLCTVHTGDGERLAETSGSLKHKTLTQHELPAIGDWVGVQERDGKRAIIHHVLPRRSHFSRKEVTRTEEQVLAANVDVAFLVSALDGGRNFNVRRMERYLSLAWDSRAEPVIVLNKIDLSEDVEAFTRDLEAVASGSPVIPVSAVTGDGIDALQAYLPYGVTGVFLGSSGVGKSSLINALIGDEEVDVGEIRGADSRGRHTTTHRELLVLPNGGLIIDTPGLREVQLWADEEAVSRSFADIEEIAESCRFSDCGHETEPGCAVKEAIERGDLDESRLSGYLKLQREVRHLIRKKDHRAAQVEKAKWKQIQKQFRNRVKER